MACTAHPLIVLPIIVILLFVVSTIATPADIKEEINNSVYTGKHFKSDFYDKAHGYMQKSHTFFNYSLEEATKAIDMIQELTPMKEISAQIPYYLAGLDYDERPVWVVELGKYNLKKLFVKYSNASKEVELIWLKACLNVLKSMDSEGQGELKQYVMILDFDGLDITQITHLPTANFMLYILRRYLDFLLEGLNTVIGINANFVAETLANISRPILGKFLERVEMFGTNKAKWLPVLRRRFPIESLPPWYGGEENWKPLLVF